MNNSIGSLVFACVLLMLLLGFIVFCVIMAVSTSKLKNQRKNNLRKSNNAASLKSVPASCAPLTSASKELEKAILSGNIASVTCEYIPDPVSIGAHMGMVGTYTDVQNDLRIIYDCLHLMDVTENLDTFFSRYETAMRSALTLQQAQKAGVKTEVQDDLVQIVTEKRSSQLEPVLIRSYESLLKGAKQLKSDNGKRGRYIKYNTLLHNYAHEYEFQCQSTFDQIMQEVRKLLKQL